MNEVLPEIEPNKSGMKSLMLEHEPDKQLNDFNNNGKKFLEIPILRDSNS